MSDVLDTYYFMKHEVAQLPYHIIDDILDYMGISEKIKIVRDVLNNHDILYYDMMIDLKEFFEQNLNEMMEIYSDHYEHAICDQCDKICPQETINICIICHASICDDDSQEQFYECGKCGYVDNICIDCDIFSPMCRNCKRRLN